NALTPDQFNISSVFIECGYQAIFSAIAFFRHVEHSSGKLHPFRSNLDVFNFMDGAAVSVAIVKMLEQLFAGAYVQLFKQQLAELRTHAFQKFYRRFEYGSRMCDGSIGFGCKNKKASQSAEGV